jgi:hypothetical protein
VPSQYSCGAFPWRPARARLGTCPGPIPKCAGQVGRHLGPASAGGGRCRSGVRIAACPRLAAGQAYPCGGRCPWPHGRGRARALVLPGPSGLGTAVVMHLASGRRPRTARGSGPLPPPLSRRRASSPCEAGAQGIRHMPPPGQGPAREPCPGVRGQGRRHVLRVPGQPSGAVRAEGGKKSVQAARHGGSPRCGGRLRRRRGCPRGGRRRRISSGSLTVPRSGTRRGAGRPRRHGRPPDAGAAAGGSRRIRSSGFTTPKRRLSGRGGSGSPGGRRVSAGAWGSGSAAELVKDCADYTSSTYGAPAPRGWHRREARGTRPWMPPASLSRWRGAQEVGVPPRRGPAFPGRGRGREGFAQADECGRRAVSWSPGDDGHGSSRSPRACRYRLDKRPLARCV